MSVFWPAIITINIIIMLGPLRRRRTNQRRRRPQIETTKDEDTGSSGPPPPQNGNVFILRVDDGANVEWALNRR